MKGETERDEQSKRENRAKIWHIEMFNTVPFTIADYTMTHQIHESVDTRVYVGADRRRNLLLAMKFERESRDDAGKMDAEVLALRALNGCGRKAHLPRLIFYHDQPGCRFIAMTRLGASLDEYRATADRRGRLSAAQSARFVMHALHAVKSVHDCGFVHRDIRPSHLVFGVPQNALRRRHVHLIAFGMSRQFAVQFESGDWYFRPLRRRVGQFRGTSMRLAPPCVHERKEFGRKDDLWALLYTLVELQGALPWTGEEPDEEMLRHKLDTKRWLLAEMPMFGRLVDHLNDLRIQERPCYDMFKNCLWELIETEVGATKKERAAWKEGGKVTEHMQSDPLRTNGGELRIATPVHTKHALFAPADVEIPARMGFKTMRKLKEDLKRRQKNMEKKMYAEKKTAIQAKLTRRKYLRERDVESKQLVGLEEQLVEQFADDEKMDKKMKKKKEK